MESVELILVAVFIAVAFLNAVANWIQVPYPILLVAGGLVLALIPGVPETELDPDLVLVIFLPPLLYSGAFFADLRSMRRYARALSLTAIVLVLITMGAVAVLAHEVIGMSWAASFALGAIVSPTDPVAAAEIMRRVNAPRRIVNLVEGESLLNDATALVAYRTAVAAAVGGSFSLLDASLEFIGAVLCGIAIGLAVGYLVAAIRRRLEDPTTEITISLFTGYAAYLPAEELGFSGVLAAVAAGVYLGFRAPELISPTTRLQGFAVWEVLVFLLNAVLFVLIGLQLPVALEALDQRPAMELVGYAAMVAAAVIAVRFAWLFTVPYVLRALDRRPAQVELRASPRERTVVAWSGMRGAVSLAAALAIPLQTDAGKAFPDRDLILFIAFGVILVTVVGQGLTLPALIRRLGLAEEDEEEQLEEARGRIAAASAALARLYELEEEGWVRPETVERVRGMYEFRKRRFYAQAGKIDAGEIEHQSLSYQRVMKQLFDAQRQELLRMRNEGQIAADVMRRIERELDLEEARLEI